MFESETMIVSFKEIGVTSLVIKDYSLKFACGCIMLRRKNAPYLSRTPMLSFASEPEEKRIIFADTFWHYVDDTIQQLNLDTKNMFLAKGVLRTNNRIGAYNNDMDRVRLLHINDRIIEPLKGIPHDEVMQMGELMGFTTEVMQRHPFPAAGFAIRVLCPLDPYMTSDFAETQVT